MLDIQQLRNEGRWVSGDFTLLIVRQGAAAVNRVVSGARVKIVQPCNLG